jgi:hypothetical protein
MKKKKPIRYPKLRIGNRVRTIGHTHPDVLPNTLGKITCKKDTGFGVEITGMWLVAGSDNGSRIKETRTVWFTPKELRKALI